MNINKIAKYNHIIQSQEMTICKQHVLARIRLLKNDFSKTALIFKFVFNEGFTTISSTFYLQTCFKKD